MSHTAPYTADQRFGLDVLTAAINGGIQHWAAVTNRILTGPPDAIAVDGVDLAEPIARPAADRPVWGVDLPGIQAAITKIVDHPEDCFSPDLRINPALRSSIPTLLRAIRDHLTQHGYPLPRFYAERIDAAMGDIVVQVALYGEVIYGPRRPGLLACPHCGCAEQLRTVELLEALAHVTFTVGSTTPTYLGHSDLLWDTQSWPDGGAIVCRNCDRIDLRLDQLVPVDAHTENTNDLPVPAPGRAAPAQPQGASR